MNASSHSARRASALVITLAILTLVSILVVGLSETMRGERASAHSQMERTHAMDFAQMGVDRVVGLLQTNLGDTSKNWCSSPGQIISSTGTGTGGVAATGTDFRLTNAVDLYSGVSIYSGTNPQACPKPILLPPNLNAVLLSDTSHHLITDRFADPTAATGTTVVLPLKWVYVREDVSSGTCSLDTTEPPTKDVTHPVIGRFAYWADDESSKINYNIAWKRPTTGTVPPSVCTVNLLALSNGTNAMTTTMADAIHSAITANNYMQVKRFFNSPQDARFLETNTAPGIAAFIDANKFELTHYNHDPDTTFFNQPRIMLTTQRGYVPQDSNGNTLFPFLDILTGTSNAYIDPGDSSKIDPAKLANAVLLFTGDTVSGTLGYLSRPGWPMVSDSTSTLQSKYYSGNSDRLAQLALNIIDYVRCKESKMELVEPTRGDNDTPHGVFESSQMHPNQVDFYHWQGPKGFAGMTRTPLINEIGVWLSADCKTAHVKVEFYLPPNFGIPSMDIISGTDPGSNPHSLVTMIGVSTSGTAWAASTEQAITAGECSGGSGTILKAGEYKVVTRAVTIPPDSKGVQPYTPANRPTSMPVRVAFARILSGSRLETVPQADWTLVPTATQNSFKLNCPIDDTTVTEGNIHSVEVDDPRVNKFAGDWKNNNSGNTFVSGTNSCYSVGKPPNSSYIPQQDTDATGKKISAASLCMPYKMGSTYNSAGKVTSPAELGLIHTGVQGSGLAGTPWRTLRLQPNNYPDTSVVPDWAFMDLFTVPPTATATSSAKPIFNPHGTAVGGRINVNSQAQPFGNSDYFTYPMERIYPLSALLLQGTSSVLSTGTTIISTPVLSGSIASAIYNHTLATGPNPGKHYSKVNYAKANGITNVDDVKTNFYGSPGEIVEIQGVADGGEESEVLIGSIANLVTTRGNVFSVYSIGQSLKELPTSDGTLTFVVRGEQRLQSMVERYLDSNTNTIKFRTVYFRNLTP